MTPRAPDIYGVGDWRAWKCKIPEDRQPNDSAVGASWLLYCPGAHAAWSYWWIDCIHLRTNPGQKPAIITLPNATHEMVCFAQNPEVDPDPDDVRKTFRYLTPVDWCVQFTVPGDAVAAHIQRKVVEIIMTGRVSPDQDFRSYWEASIRATAKHYAEGKHPLA